MTPQAIPLAKYERNPFFSLLVKVARGVFQRCVETTFWNMGQVYLLTLFYHKIQKYKCRYIYSVHRFYGSKKWMFYHYRVGGWSNPFDKKIVVKMGSYGSSSSKLMVDKIMFETTVPRSFNRFLWKSNRVSTNFWIQNSHKSTWKLMKEIDLEV